MELRNNILASILLALLIVVGVTTFVVAATLPVTPKELTTLGSSSFDTNNYGLQTTVALAGNITQMFIYAIGQTKSWQGYYGNISGTITLDDANNFTFYNWSVAEPRGQIYATLNSSMAWASVQCFNFSGPGTNLTTMENFYRIQPNDADNVNQTYNNTNHPLFDVGSRTMIGCPTTYIFQNDQSQADNFVNVLLWDNTQNESGWIYTTIIEDKTNNSVTDFPCYNGQICDFQLLVNEDGHRTDTSTTTYYFWVELI